jgi:DUF917 family protein
MPQCVLRTLTDVEDFVRGCTFMGTGGGGDPKKGVASLKKLLDEGKEIKWVDADIIGDDDWTVCPFLMGSIAPLTEETKERMSFFGLHKPVYDNTGILAKAMSELAAFQGVELSAVIPIELGGANTPGGVAAGLTLGLKVVDGDYTGRAIPEAQQTTPYLAEKPMWPITSIDEWGNVVVIRDAINYLMAERIGKMISAAAFGLSGDAGFLIPGKDMKQVVVRGTLTKCLKIGGAIREARERGDDAVKEVTDMLDGWVVMRGMVTKKEWDDRDGYYWGYHTIRGEREYDGVDLKIWFKNENHVSWRNGKPFVTSPDMIIVVDEKTGEPYTNTEIAEGMKVAVICLKAVPQFRTERGVGILGPKYFGFNIEYEPVEELLGP